MKIMTFFGCAAFLLWTILGCALSTYEISKMTSEQIKDITDDQLLLAAQKNNVYRNRTILEESVRRGLHPLAPREIDLILSSRLLIGMSEDALVLSWGRPNEINRSAGPYGVRKQYVYGAHSKYSEPTYVYIENGKVIRWQD